MVGETLLACPCKALLPGLSDGVTSAFALVDLLGARPVSMASSMPVRVSGEAIRSSWAHSWVRVSQVPVVAGAFTLGGGERPAGVSGEGVAETATPADVAARAGLQLSSRSHRRAPMVES